MTTAAFRETLGWGAGGKIGLKQHTGFGTMESFWSAVVTKFRLTAGYGNRRKLREHKVLPYCKRGLIVLHDGETLLGCAARVHSWAGGELVVCSVTEVHSTLSGAEV